MKSLMIFLWVIKPFKMAGFFVENKSLKPIKDLRF